MRRSWLQTLPALVSMALLALPASALAASYRQVGTISLSPQASTSFDISYVDQPSQTYYLGDRTSKGVDVVDAATGAFVQTLGAGRFTGAQKSPDTSGPDGVLRIGNDIWAGDGNSTVKVIDATTGALVASINTGGKARADELSYDPKADLVLIANDADNPPFLSFISTTSDKVVGRISYPNATDGLEQSVYDPSTGMFYQNVPQTKTNAGGEIDTISPATMKVVSVLPLPGCFPAGLALGPGGNAVVGCSSDAIAAGHHAKTLVVNLPAGKIVATVGVGGSDEVWYDSGSDNYFAAADAMTSTGLKGGAKTPVLAVIDAATNRLVQTIPTAAHAHSVAVDAANGHVLVPIPGKGIAVYAPAAAAATPAAAGGGAPAKLPKTGQPLGYPLFGLGLLALGGGLLFQRRRR